MNDHIPFEVDSIEIRAAKAFAASRRCAVALRQDVIPNLKRFERRSPEHLITVIGRQRIFYEATINQLEGLIETMSRRVVDGTTTAEQFVADECHVDGGGTQTHQQRTTEAEALSRALPCLIDLREHLHAVFDLMHAIRALDELRQRI